jgi:mono/diheme cytochrome c family protein
MSAVRALFLILISVVLAAVLMGILAWSVLARGTSARDEPSQLETVVARRLRQWAIPAHARHARSPVPASADVVAEGRAHFADHCAVCHANDGSGRSEFGPGLYPKPPDLRQSPTQSMTDGEICYIIHNGIRFTGMPAFGSGPPDQDVDSWKLVHFIRHLPAITPSELQQMERLNPKSPGEQEQVPAVPAASPQRRAQPQTTPHRHHHHH